MANIAVQNTEISVLNYNEQDYIPLTDMKNADRTVLPFRLDCLCFILERTLWFWHSLSQAVQRKRSQAVIPSSRLSFGKW